MLVSALLSICSCATLANTGQVHPSLLANSSGGCSPHFVPRESVGLKACLPPDDAIRAAAAKFAPEVHLYPAHTVRFKGMSEAVADSGDINRPSSVDWYLQHVRLRFHRTSVGFLWRDLQMLSVGEVNPNALVNQSWHRWRSGEGEQETNFFLQINPAAKFAVMKGDLESAECYVHFRPARNGAPGVEIQYWFFYPYNGDITKILTTAHEGDWEHITLRLTADLNTIQAVYYSSHEGEGLWYEPHQFHTTRDGRPIVYSARRSHASYPTAGEHARGPVKPNDFTAPGGEVWRTWERLAFVGTPQHPSPGYEWIAFTGRWGERGWPIVSFWFSSSGPLGPAFQSAWFVDP